MSVRESLLVLDKGPDFFVRQYRTEPDHAGAGRAVFNDPEDLSFGAVPPETVVLKITWGRIQIGRRRPFAVSVYSVTGKAGAPRIS